MSKFFLPVISIICLLPLVAVASELVPLDKGSYKPNLGVFLTHVNWGRTWECGTYENVQIQSLTFTKTPIENTKAVAIKFESPSRLFVENNFLLYASVVQPGEYSLTGFDVKVAKSITDIAHIKGTIENLTKDGKSLGGTISVNPGEIVYVGHFGIDCVAEPFLWRYYIEGRDEFEKYVEEFRKKHPFVKDRPVHFRLFSSELLGRPYSLNDAIVE